ncbi:MAG: CAP domain-containing protein [Acutalibacteraceae bacterium]|jgi:uncharacterized protein YkwD
MKTKLFSLLIIAVLVFSVGIYAVSFLTNPVRGGVVPVSEGSVEQTINMTSAEPASDLPANSTDTNNYIEKTAIRLKPEDEATTNEVTDEYTDTDTELESEIENESKCEIEIESAATTAEEITATAKPPQAARVSPQPVKPVATQPPPATTTKPTPPPTTTKAPAKPAQPAYSCKLDNLIGKPLADITAQFGNPAAQEKSEYGFSWYVYHKNYANFVMVGIQNNTVVGLYSNSPTLSFEGVKVGASKSTVRSAFSSKYTGPVTSILKGNTQYILDKTDQRDVFSDSQKYVTVFYDTTKGGTLTAIQVIAYSAEQTLKLLPLPSKQTSDSYEKLSFYLANSIRVRNSLDPVRYDKKLETVSREHSQDMLNRNYFNHNTPEGVTPKQRIQAAGIDYRAFGENIAKNHPSAISTHESYMNSSGHRANILGNFTHLGVGVAMNANALYQTQLFVRY